MALEINSLVAGPQFVDRQVYTDPDIFELERKLIFERAWQYIAHVSEFEKPGDFRTVEIAGQPLVAIKGDDDKVRVFFNSCRHKATVVMEEKGGSCDRMMCPYHHWTYDRQGRLTSVPRMDAYGAGFKMEDYGLIEVPKVASFHGMIFASLSPEASSLEEFLGPAAPYFAEVAKYDGEDLVVLGTYDYTYDGNWKLIMENTLDDYHAAYLHAQAFGQRAEVFKMSGTSGYQEVAGKRWSVELKWHGAYDQIDDERTLVIQKRRSRRVYIGLFPNYLALYHPIWDVTGLRIAEPISVDRTRVRTYCLAPASADEETRRQVAERYHYSWGPGGRAGVDDILVLARVQRGLKAATAGKVVISRGLEDRPGWKGGPADDHAVRGFWNGWRHFMQESA